MMTLTSEQLRLVESFADAARKYCAWVESTRTDTIEDLFEVQVLLSDLHRNAIELPQVDPLDDSGPSRMSDEEWKAVYDKLSNLPLNNYWEVFDPLDHEDTEAVCGSLADDLADIYRDVKSQLTEYDQRNSANVAWQWRFDYWTHWGQHLTGALRAIHAFISKEQHVC